MLAGGAASSGGEQGNTHRRGSALGHGIGDRHHQASHDHNLQGNRRPPLGSAPRLEWQKRQDVEGFTYWINNLSQEVRYDDVEPPSILNQGAARQYAHHMTSGSLQPATTHLMPSASSTTQQMYPASSQQMHPASSQQMYQAATHLMPSASSTTQQMYPASSQQMPPPHGYMPSTAANPYAGQPTMSQTPPPNQAPPHTQQPPAHAWR